MSRLNNAAPFLDPRPTHTGFGAGAARSTDGLTVTELAGRLGTTVRALRHYEDAGMLRPDRTSGNVRRYGPQARGQAGLVVALRRAGVSLSEIQNLMVVDPDRRRDDLRQILEDRLRVARRSVCEIESLLDDVRSEERSAPPQTPVANSAEVLLSNAFHGVEIR